MSVSSIAAANNAAQLFAASKIAANQAVALDSQNDGDSDDGVTAKVQPAPAPGMGKSVDKTA
jgi:hypothetical protein